MHLYEVAKAWIPLIDPVILNTKRQQNKIRYAKQLQYNINEH
jgi:hypothetical protein